MKRLWAVVLPFLLAACAGSPAATPPPAPTPTPALTINGSVNVPAVGFDDESGQPCTSKAGYSDIAYGAQVTVTDEAGIKLAVTSLGTGTSDDRGTDIYVYCSYGFLLADVPDGKSLYSIHVGNQARGEVAYKRASLDTSVTLTIG